MKQKSTGFAPVDFYMEFAERTRKYIKM